MNIVVIVLFIAAFTYIPKISQEIEKWKMVECGKGPASSYLFQMAFAGKSREKETEVLQKRKCPHL